MSSRPTAFRLGALTSYLPMQEARERGTGNHTFSLATYADLRCVPIGSLLSISSYPEDSKNTFFLYRSR